MARTPIGSAYIYILMALIGYMVADLTILSFRDGLLPQQAPPERPPQIQNIASAPRDKFNVITSRNMFNWDGKIPPAIGASQAVEQEVDPDPVPTTISGLVLNGTLVHTNPAKSVVSLKTPTSGDNVAAYKITEVIDGVGELLEISRGRIVFRNVVSRRREFLELPDAAKLNLGLSQGTKPARVEGEVAVISETDRQLKREDVTKLTSNLPELLQQARAVKDGDCFRMLDIMPGSIYERLGIKRGDCIKSVNGEVVDTPQKAMELYNALKNSNNISLGVDRNGRQETLNFTIQ